MLHPEPMAHLGGQLARGLLDVTRDIAAVDAGGWWAVVATYEGETVCARFADVRPAATPGGPWAGPGVGSWSTSLAREQYVAAVEQVRELIAAGTVYQANVCRVMCATLPDPERADVAGLAALLAAGNPAPYSGSCGCRRARTRHWPTASHVATASPELFLRRSGPVVGVRTDQGHGAHRRRPARTRTGPRTS